MDPWLLVLSWLVVFVAGVEVGGRWAAWVAMTAVRHAGVEWEYQQALERLTDPEAWRNR